MFADETNEKERLAELEGLPPNPCKYKYDTACDRDAYVNDYKLLVESHEAEMDTLWRSFFCGSPELPASRKQEHRTYHLFIDDHYACTQTYVLDDPTGGYDVLVHEVNDAYEELEKWPCGNGALRWYGSRRLPVFYRGRPLFIWAAETLAKGICMVMPDAMRGNIRDLKEHLLKAPVSLEGMASFSARL